MPAPLRKRVLEVPQQPLGFGRVVTVLGQSLDQEDLLGHALLAFGDVAICLGEIFTLLLEIR